jgi:hypothetical protein
MPFANTFRAYRHRDYLIFWGGLLLSLSGSRDEVELDEFGTESKERSTISVYVEGFS